MAVPEEQIMQSFLCQIGYRKSASTERHKQAFTDQSLGAVTYRGNADAIFSGNCCNHDFRPRQISSANDIGFQPCVDALNRDGFG
ncbi:hypothetical protein AWL63_18530 [Sphingomonas panacis]|uniref:Uncharacterized protein n=1 Tax=Sphingomonas panacis TaxID=1560345 RepID=A0A1B3ZDY7_9SPHN|nr:hypothetical protein AWL63_18530 [Sphingomonas panacis]